MWTTLKRFRIVNLYLVGLYSTDSHPYLQRERKAQRESSAVKLLRLNEILLPYLFTKRQKSLRDQLREIMVWDGETGGGLRSLLMCNVGLLLIFYRLRRGEGEDCGVLTYVLWFEKERYVEDCGPCWFVMWALADILWFEKRRGWGLWGPYWFVMWALADILWFEKRRGEDCGVLTDV